MKKSKSLFDTDKTGELSRQVTRERLKKAGVTPSNTKSDDPDLEALFEAVRSVNDSGSKKDSLPDSILRKLGGVS